MKMIWMMFLVFFGSMLVTATYGAANREKAESVHFYNLGKESKKAGVPYSGNQGLTLAQKRMWALGWSDQD